MSKAAKSVEELEVFQKAVVASAEVSAIIERPSWQRYLRLREQVGCASERVLSAISKGSSNRRIVISRNISIARKARAAKSGAS